MSKSDHNAREIVEALRKIGAVVWFIEAAYGRAGLPDLLVGYKGRTYLLEVKMRKGRVSDEQRKFFETWPGGTAAIVHDVDEALGVLLAHD